MGNENEELIRQLNSLNENISLLNTLTAISMGKETILKDKKDNWDKIEALEGYNLPDKYIALIIGSTPNSIQVLRSKNKKTKKGKNVTEEPKQEPTTA